MVNAKFHPLPTCSRCFSSSGVYSGLPYTVQLLLNTSCGQTTMCRHHSGMQVAITWRTPHVRTSESGAGHTHGNHPTFFRLCLRHASIRFTAPTRLCV
jgi:hypothetical protein